MTSVLEPRTIYRAQRDRWLYFFMLAPLTVIFAGWVVAAPWWSLPVFIYPYFYLAAGIKIPARIELRDKDIEIRHLWFCGRIPYKRILDVETHSGSLKVALKGSSRSNSGHSYRSS